jgi:hypothetical protein
MEEKQKEILFRRSKTGTMINPLDRIKLTRIYNRW